MNFASTRKARRLLLGMAATTLASVQLGLGAAPSGMKTNDQAVAAAARGTPKLRGEIWDRHGLVLARTVPTVSIYADLPMLRAQTPQRWGTLVATLSPLLRLPGDELSNRWYSAAWEAGGKASGRQAVALRRNVPETDWLTLSNTLRQSTFGMDSALPATSEPSGLNGLRQRLLFTRPGARRVYPFAEKLAPVLGFVTAPEVDRANLRGVDGIEAQFDSELESRAAEPAAGGNRVVLTIDMLIQQVAENALLEAVRKSKPRAASVLVAHPRTGELLAWACWPSFHPGQPGASPPEHRRNRPLSDSFEPGSVFGFVTVAAALDGKAASLEDQLDCGHGRFHFEGTTLREATPHGVLSVGEILARSSNIGLAQIALRLGAERGYQYMTNFGFGHRGERPGFLPGETAGYLQRPSHWNRFTLTRLAFGQGIGVSQLQLTMAFCAIANEGWLMRPRIVSRIESAQGEVLRSFPARSARMALRPETCVQMLKALQLATSSEGTGAPAAVPGFTVAGKTGTALKAGRQGYLSNRYVASFVGVVPATNPQFCISIVVDEPTGALAGSEVAAPLFAKIARQALDAHRIPPDAPDAEGRDAR